MESTKKQRGRCGKHWLLVLMGLALAFATSACQIQLSFTRPPVAADAPTPTATIAASVTATPTETTAPALTPTPTDLPVTATDTPAPAPTIALPTATPTATPLIPAQQPPDEIIIPAIGLTAAVTRTTWSVVSQNGRDVTVWHVPDYAAGWHVNSALPGQGSNVVLSGHHNIKGEVFRDIVKLNPGDEIELHADGRFYHYTVSDRFIIPERGVPEAQRRQNALWIMPTTDERLTLVTCYPYTDNSHRVIVIAKPAAMPQQIASKLP